MSKKIRVLVDGVGGDVGQGILKSLLNTKLNIELYASCISDKSSWLYKIENSYIFPLVSDKNFIDFLVDFINEHKIDVYFPTVDSTLLKISKYKNFIENKTNVKIFIDNLQKIEICDDKYLTNKFLVKNGDLLICEGGEVGRCSILSGISENTIIQNALHRVRESNKSTVKYLDYVIQHTANSKWFSILCNKATIAHLTSEKLINLSIPLPPLTEQTAIADYLDEQTAHIDCLSQKVEQAIGRLKEYRTALITQAVTGKIKVITEG